ncbi:hypothetical protein GCM10009663_54900 [Kitasatospora arboriphila]|uniref:Uncharacterized protein n=1 Tax=Kitasatospora arboriphila TaxID=258052 RepID=A0ABP4EHS1_9ACTN
MRPDLQVRLQRPGAAPAAVQQQPQGVGDPGGALAGRHVPRPIRAADGVLDVHVGHVVGDLQQHPVAVVAVRDAVAGVEEQPQGRAVHGGDQVEHPLGRTARPAAAVLVQQDEAQAVGEFGEGPHPLQHQAAPLGLRQARVGVGHHPDEPGAEGGAARPEGGELVEVAVEGVGDGARPVADPGGRADDPHPALGDPVGDPPDGVLGQVGDPLPVDGAQLQVVPAEPGQGGELAGQVGGGLVADAGEADPRCGGGGGLRGGGRGGGGGRGTGGGRPDRGGRPGGGLGAVEQADHLGVDREIGVRPAAARGEVAVGAADEGGQRVVVQQLGGLAVPVDGDQLGVGVGLAAGVVPDQGAAGEFEGDPALAHRGGHVGADPRPDPGAVLDLEPGAAEPGQHPAVDHHVGAARAGHLARPGQGEAEAERVRQLDVEGGRVAVGGERAGEAGLALDDVDGAQRPVRAGGEHGAQPVGEPAAEPLGDHHQVESVAVADGEQVVQAAGVGGQRLLDQDPAEAEPAESVQHGGPGGGRCAQVHHAVGRVEQPGGLGRGHPPQVGGGRPTALRVGGQHRGRGEQPGGVRAGAESAEHRQVQAEARTPHADEQCPESVRHGEPSFLPSRGSASRTFNQHTDGGFDRASNNLHRRPFEGVKCPGRPGRQPWSWRRLPAARPGIPGSCPYDLMRVSWANTPGSPSSRRRRVSSPSGRPPGAISTS